MENLESFELSDVLERCGFYESVFKYENCVYLEKGDLEGYINDEYNIEIMSRLVDSVFGENIIYRLKEFFEGIKKGLFYMMLEGGEVDKNNVVNIGMGGGDRKIWVSVGKNKELYIFSNMELIDDEREYIESREYEKDFYCGNERLEGIDFYYIEKSIFLGLSSERYIYVV